MPSKTTELAGPSGDFRSQPLIARVTISRLGPAGFWAVASLALYGASVSLLWYVSAGRELHLAFALVAVGQFFCCWGTVVGAELLSRHAADFDCILDAPSDRVRRDLTVRFRSWAAGRRSLLAGLFFGTLVTAAILLQNQSQPTSEFATAFDRSNGLLYLPVWIAGFAIGIGHAAIAGALRTIAILRRYPVRLTYCVVRLCEISKTYLLLALLCLSAYLSFLGYVFSMWWSGTDLSPLVNGLAVAVGGAVLAVSLYPQWIVHEALEDNRRRLLDEAIRHVEALRSADRIPTPEERQEILRALEYVQVVEELPVVGFRWRELAGVTVGYVLPILGFLAAQTSRVAEFLR